MVSTLRKGDFGALFGPLAPIIEEVAEQCGGFGFEEAASDEYGVVEAGVGRSVVEGTCVSGFGIGGRVDQAREAGCVGGAGAHGARLQGGVEGTACQAPAACSGGCASDGEELCVCGGVPCCLALVGGDGQDLPSPGDDGSDWNLPHLGGILCGEQGAAHHYEIRTFSGVGLDPLVHGADDSRSNRTVCQSSLSWRWTWTTVDTDENGHRWTRPLLACSSVSNGEFGNAGTWRSTPRSRVERLLWGEIN